MVELAVERLADVLCLDVADGNALAGQNVVRSAAINPLWFVGDIDVGLPVPSTGFADLHGNCARLHFHPCIAC